jgi:hypothetical protein
MTGLDIITLIAVTIAAAIFVGTYIARKQPPMEEFLEQPKKQKFQPRKVTVAPKQGIAQLTQSAKELIKEVDKVTGKETSPEETSQLAKQMVEAAVTTPKKKRKYYPKKNKA